MCISSLSPMTTQKYGMIYLKCHKSEAFEKFKEFRAEVETQLEKSIKVLCSD